MTARRPVPAPGVDTVLEPTSAIAWVEVDDQVVVWSDATQELHHLDPIATLVFRLCDGTSTLGDTVADLARLFGREPDQIRGDVTRCVEQRLASGLVQPLDSGSGVPA